MMKSDISKRYGIVIGSAVLLAWTANAGAGEIKGNGEPIEVNGKSECAYSGLQDDAEEDEGIFRNIRVQTWGQMSKELRAFLASIGLHPGDACNPSKQGDEDP